jgi:hypothetical protein
LQFSNETFLPYDFFNLGLIFVFFTFEYVQILVLVKFSYMVRKALFDGFKNILYDIS